MTFVVDVDPEWASEVRKGTHTQTHTHVPVLSSSRNSLGQATKGVCIGVLHQNTLPRRRGVHVDKSQEMGPRSGQVKKFPRDCNPNFKWSDSSSKVTRLPLAWELSSGFLTVLILFPNGCWLTACVGVCRGQRDRGRILPRYCCHSTCVRICCLRLCFVRIVRPRDSASVCIL